MSYFFVTLLLTISLVALWVIPWRRFWVYPFGVALIVGLIFKILSWLALLPIAFLFFLVFPEKKKGGIYDFFIFVIVSTLFLHKFPGFHNLQILSQAVIAPCCLPYTFYLNFDKMIAGILLMSFIPLCRTSADWKIAAYYCLICSLIVIAILLVLTWFLNYVDFQPKWPAIAPIWIFSNLCITSVSEEAFFRGFIQKKLEIFWSRYSWGNIGALLIASIFFGLAHFPAGLLFAFFSAIAGIFYGFAFQKSGKIEAAIGVHFLLNLTHFIGFSYPGLAP